MPFPSKINRESIIAEAVTMIEAEGVDRLSVNVLAERLGVKTPSLYRYFANKTDLLRAVNEETVEALFRAITPALEAPGAAADRVQHIARVYRDFAHQHPATYGLLYTNTIAELRPDEQTLVRLVLPFQALMAEISGEAESLAALRGLVALMHGFIMLELAGQLRRGGDLDAAYRASIAAYLRGWGQSS